MVEAKKYHEKVSRQFAKKEGWHFDAYAAVNMAVCGKIYPGKACKMHSSLKHNSNKWAIPGFQCSFTAAGSVCENKAKTPHTPTFSSLKEDELCIFWQIRKSEQVQKATFHAYCKNAIGRNEKRRKKLLWQFFIAKMMRPGGRATSRFTGNGRPAGKSFHSCFKKHGEMAVKHGKWTPWIRQILIYATGRRKAG